jgi:hypothetical protein
MNRVRRTSPGTLTAMSFAFPSPDYMPCPDCGASLPVDGGENPHVCEEERRVEYRLVELQPEIEQFDGDLAAWLDTPAGRFEQWLAERNRDLGG